MRLDVKKVDFFRLREELTPKDLRSEALISEETWEKVLHNQEITLDSAIAVRKAIRAPDLFSIMHDTKLTEFAGMLSIGPTGSVLPDWDFVEPLSGELQASNGIKYTLWKLRHVLEENRFARGKRYELSGLSTLQFNERREYLARHGEICNRFLGHPQFSRHYTTTPAPRSALWWVVDDWTPGRTLEEALREKTLPVQDVPRVMREIADGIKALHDVEIIRRELSPRFIILREPDDTVVFTDFELAKLLDGSPTVRTEFPHDLYRAPDADGELTFNDRHVDLYSWGRIAFHAVTGREPPKPGAEEDELRQVKLPTKVRETLLRCVSPDGTRRPQCVEEVQKAISGWK